MNATEIYSHLAAWFAEPSSSKTYDDELYQPDPMSTGWMWRQIDCVRMPNGKGVSLQTSVVLTEGDVPASASCFVFHHDQLWHLVAQAPAPCLQSLRVFRQHHQSIQREHVWLQRGLHDALERDVGQLRWVALFVLAPSFLPTRMVESINAALPPLSMSSRHMEAVSDAFSAVREEGVCWHADERHPDFGLVQTAFGDHQFLYVPVQSFPPDQYQGLEGSKTFLIDGTPFWQVGPSLNSLQATRLFASGYLAARTHSILGPRDDGWAAEANPGTLPGAAPLPREDAFGRRQPW